MELSTRERFSRFFLLCGLVGTILLVVIANQRLNDGSISVVIGLIVGGLAVLVPLGIVGVIVYLIVRGMEARAQMRGGQGPQQQPAVLIVNPNQGQQLPYQQDQPMIQAPQRRRQFTVLGED